MYDLTLTLAEPTFGRLERVALLVGLHPDDILAGAEFADAALPPGAETDVLQTVLAEADVSSDDPALVALAAWCLIEFFAACRAAAATAHAQARHYARRLGVFLSAGGDAVSLARVLAGLPVADECLLRTMPLHDMLHCLLMRAIVAEHKRMTIA